MRRPRGVLGSLDGASRRGRLCEEAREYWRLKAASSVASRSRASGAGGSSGGFSVPAGGSRSDVSGIIVQICSASRRGGAGHQLHGIVHNMGSLIMAEHFVGFGYSS